MAKWRWPGRRVEVEGSLVGFLCRRVGAAWRRDGALREGSLWQRVWVCGGVS